MADMSKAEKLAAARKKLKEFQQKSKDGSSVIKTSSRKRDGNTKNDVNDATTSRNFVFDSGPHDPELQGRTTGAPSEGAFQDPIAPSHQVLELVSSVGQSSDCDLALRQSSPDSNPSSGNVSMDPLSARDFFDSFPGNTQGGLVNQKPQDNSTSYYYDIVEPSNIAPSPVVDLFTAATTAPSTIDDYVTTRNMVTLPANGYDTIDVVDPGAKYDQHPSTVAECVSTWTIAQPPLTEDLIQRNLESSFLHPVELFPTNSSPLIVTPATDVDVLWALDVENVRMADDVMCMLDDGNNYMPDGDALHTSNGKNLQAPDIQALQVSDGVECTPVSARSTSESIRQLSQQMNGLIGEEAQATVSRESSQLESRNQELAALLDIERQSREQLQLQLKEYQTHVSKLSSQLEAQRLEAESRLSQEVSSVQEQLKLHIQTVGILVAEKTELQSSLTHCQADARLKISEVEDLQGRLKASRYRVSELEKELLVSRTALESSESSRAIATKELDQLRLNNLSASTRERELEEERAELNHRLLAKTKECGDLGRELHEMQTRLSLAQLRVTQLGSGDAGDNSAQLEALHQAKIAVEQRVAELESALKKSESEHDRSGQQFQQYVRGVEMQMSELTEKVERLEAEKQRFSEREKGLMSHLVELERRIQLQDVQHRPEHLPSPDKKLHGRLSQLEEEKEYLSKELRMASHRTGELEAEVHERESRVEELEAMLDRMQSDQPDQGCLLAAMESDKVAAARAVSQNHRLKVELQELQDGFVMLSNCKLDLTDKLEHERHRSRQLEGQIAQLRVHIEEHEKSDHAHHHSHDDSSYELTECKERLQAVSSENNELRRLLAQLTLPQDQSPKGIETHNNEPVSSLCSHVKLLELERIQLKEQLCKMADVKQSGGDTTICAVSNEAMDQLQEQFTRKMMEIADLSDEKQRLEHLVLQLQGETETIGEYITLYQKQRGLLRQRAEEKDNQLKCLAQDREEMRIKLAKLNDLIGRLVAEKMPGEKKTVTEEGLTNGELLEIEKQVTEKMSSIEKSGSEAGIVGPENIDTAGKILALLSEIGTSNLVDPHHPVEHFHPCAWCSGRLITV